MGTTNGFNSEAFEHLHIEFAKLGYQASNKNDYAVQMVQWLTCQEAVHQFITYLQWAMPHYTVQQNAASDADHDNDVENKPEEDECKEEVEEEAFTIYIPDCKDSTISKNMISTLAHDYKAPNSLYHLQNIMNTQSIAP